MTFPERDGWTILTYNARVPDHNPISGIVPRSARRPGADEDAIVEQIEKIEGEVGLDAHVKALMSSPEIAARIEELENRLQKLANLVSAEPGWKELPAIRKAVEEAGLVLKNRLEVGDLTSMVKKRIRAKMDPFMDELGLMGR
jgi:hypothetical protein